ncbi:AlpA family phage regulatory protein [Dickeya poaceiphila]|uniref:AlpA family phage regulatory protein n=1 Tax=Dickeya poaceiphila TaxID=568768 RepID=UPI0003A02C82|nr:AlpA family phage regulatory protein [Dickeya poaceiphila]
MTSHQLLRLRQVEEKTGLKRSQIYLYMKDGAFPASIKIGPASVAPSVRIVVTPIENTNDKMGTEREAYFTRT